MAAPFVQGPSHEHTHGRMLRLLDIVYEIDAIEMRLEAIETARNMRFKMIPREKENWSYRCPDCNYVLEVDKLLKPKHHHICLSCSKVVQLIIILPRLHHQESAPT